MTNKEISDLIVHDDSFYEMRQEWIDDCEGMDWHSYIIDHWVSWAPKNLIGEWLEDSDIEEIQKEILLQISI
jgi:hypothetical protein